MKSNLSHGKNLIIQSYLPIQCELENKCRHLLVSTSRVGVLSDCALAVHTRSCSVVQFLVSTWKLPHTGEHLFTVCFMSRIKTANKKKRLPSAQPWNGDTLLLFRNPLRGNEHTFVGLKSNKCFLFRVNKTFWTFTEIDFQLKYNPHRHTSNFLSIFCVCFVVVLSIPEMKEK